MAISHVASVSVAAGINGGTTGSIDTTGANLLVLSVAHFSTVTISDSKGNSWNALTAQTTGGGWTHRLYYVRNPTVGSGHTFTVSGSGIYAGLVVHAYGDASGAPIFFDTQQNGATTGSGTSLAAGSVTPVVDGSLVVSGIALGGNGSNNSTPPSVDSSLTSTWSAGVAGNALNCTLAYKVQSTAAAINPSWSWASSDGAGASVAVFRPYASGVIFRENVKTSVAWNATGSTTFSSGTQCHTTGNALVVVVGEVSQTPSSVTDTAGNTYTMAVDVTGGDGYKTSIWYAKNITGHASNAVTATFSGNASFVGIVVLQYGGLSATAPLDVTATGTASGSVVTTGSLTTTQAAEVHVIAPRWGLINGITWPSGFANVHGDSVYNRAADSIVASTYSGTYTITHVDSFSYLTAVVATFKADAGGGGARSSCRGFIGL